MKRTTITTLLLLIYVLTAWSQQQSEVIKKELTFEKTDQNNVFYLSNINGDIKVEGYDGNKILVEAKKTIFGKTQSRVDKGMSDISIGVIDRYDTIIVYMTGPCGKFSNRNFRRNDNGRSSYWNYNWNNCQEHYDFRLDFTVKVPRNQSIYVSTINNGNVKIQGVSGQLSSHNINGDIALKDIESSVIAHTINGDVDLDFKKNPTIDSKFYSLNGDIVANFKPQLSADMSFKSFNGEFFTNLSSIKHLPMKMEKTEARNKKGIAYKLDGKSMMRSRNGGVYLDFETFNGDVYVKEIN